MQVCCVCKEEKNLDEFNRDKYKKSGRRSQCKECMVGIRVEQKPYIKKYMEDPERKKKYAEYRRSKYQEEKNRIKARNAARKLKREPCEVCGEENVHAHHDDYSKHLEVRWLCPKHHGEWHRINGKGLNP